MTADTFLQVGSRYATGLSRSNIERALVAAGKNLEHLQPADLDVVEDFHTVGRIATTQLAELAEISGHDRVLRALVKALAACVPPHLLQRIPGLRNALSVRPYL